MKLVFMGSPASARTCLERILDAGHQVEMVITQPDRPAGRGRKTRHSPVKSCALERGLPLLQPTRIRKDHEVLPRLQEIGPDLIVVAAYGQIIPGSIIYLPRYNTVNLHYSLLPRWRGASPVQWALLQGDPTTGVTVFELDEKMDEGPIYAAKELDVLPGENAAGLEKRLTELGAGLLVELIPRLPELSPVAQDDSMATYARLIRKEDGQIDWTQSAVEIDRHVRAYTPWPSAYTFLKNSRLKILKGRFLQRKETTSAPPGGYIESIDAAGLLVICGDGIPYLIEELQPESRSPMSARAFALGARLQAGAALG